MDVGDSGGCVLGGAGRGGVVADGGDGFGFCAERGGMDGRVFLGAVWNVGCDDGGDDDGVGDSVFATVLAVLPASRTASVLAFGGGGRGVFGFVAAVFGGGGGGALGGGRMAILKRQHRARVFGGAGGAAGFGRTVSIDSAQNRVFARLSSGGLAIDFALAARLGRRVFNRRGQRRFLCRLLLGADASFVCRRRNGFAMDCRPRLLRAFGKIIAALAVACKIDRRRVAGGGCCCFGRLLKNISIPASSSIPAKAEISRHSNCLSASRFQNS